MNARREPATSMSGEDRLIARHFKPLARHPGALGLIDDAATLKVPPGHELVLTTDAIVGGVHFLTDDREQGAAGQSLRPCRQGRDPGGVSAHAGTAQAGRRRLVGGVCTRAWP